MRGLRPRVPRLLIGILAVAALAALVAGPGGATKAGEKLKVALIVVGPENDGSWSNAWSDGAKKAAKEFGVDLKIVGNVVTPDQFLAQASAFGPRGYDLVIKGGGPFSLDDKDVTVQLAKRFPKTIWCYVPYDFKNGVRGKQGPPNLCLADIEQQEGTFRAGLLAGLMTKTNKLATVNGFQFAPLTRQPEAFQLGAQCVNSKVTVAQKYINSWADTVLAKAAADSFIADGADILLAATDQASQGMFEAAKAHPGTYVIPSYFDAHKQAPTVILTSVLYNLQGVGYDLIKRLVTNTLPSHYYKNYNFKNFGVGQLAPFYELSSKVPASVKAKLKELDQQILAGKIKIPDETRGAKTIALPGSANKINVKSLGCKPIK